MVPEAREEAKVGKVRDHREHTGVWPLSTVS
jgi:hypothetical protein